MRTLSFVLFISIASIAFAQDDQQAGTVVRFSSNQLIIRNSDPAEPFQIGDKLYVLVDNTKIGLTVVYPMQTSARCKVSSGNSRIAKSITTGIPVYRAGDGAADDSNTDESTVRKVSVFKDNGNGTVTDSRTKLVWLKDANQPDKMMTYDEAETWVRTINIAGFTKWRIPTKKEIEFLCKNTFDDMNESFDNIQIDRYWTSTPFDSAKSGIVCDLSTGVSRNSKKSNRARVIPVMSN